MFPFPVLNACTHTYTQSCMDKPSLKGLQVTSNPLPWVCKMYTPFPRETWIFQLCPYTEIKRSVKQNTKLKLHPAMPPNYLECSDSRQLLGTLPGSAWAVIVMPQGDALQCQTMSECFCFPCKPSPLQPVEYFHVFLRLLFHLSLSLFHNSLCLSHQLLFNPTDSPFPFNICCKHSVTHFHIFNSHTRSLLTHLK